MSTKPDDSAPGVLDRVRAHPTGRVVLRVGIGVLGAALVALGLALIPLPGPGWALVILGLAVWALEFVWARSLLDFTRRQVRRWSRWVGRQPLLVRCLVGAAGVLLVGATVWASVRFAFHVDLVAVVGHWLARR
jgi:uncharacterized protein (TIGR02611 family)